MSRMTPCDITFSRLVRRNLAQPQPQILISCSNGNFEPSHGARAVSGYAERAAPSLESWEISVMSHVKRASKRRPRSKALPALRAAGLSLSLASGASAATTDPVANTQTPNTAASYEITLREEEIFEVGLATFYVFDKESPQIRQSRSRVSGGCGCGGCACCAGFSGCSGCSSGVDYEGSTVGSNVNQPHYSAKPSHKRRRLR